MPISDLGLWGTNNMAGQNGPGGQMPPGGGAGTQNGPQAFASGLSPLAQMVLQRAQSRQQNNPLIQANQQLAQVVPRPSPDMPPLQPPPAPGQTLAQQFPPVGQTGVNTLPPTPPKSLASAGSPESARQFDTAGAGFDQKLGGGVAPGGFDPGSASQNPTFGGGVGGPAGMPNLPPNIIQQALGRALEGGPGLGGGGPAPQGGGGDVRQGIIQGLLSNFGF